MAKPAPQKSFFGSLLSLVAGLLAMAVVGGIVIDSLLLPAVPSLRPLVEATRAKAIYAYIKSVRAFEGAKE